MMLMRPGTELQLPECAPLPVIMLGICVHAACAFLPGHGLKDTLHEGHFQ